MATYAITLDEKTNDGKALKQYLRSLGVLLTKLPASQQSSYLSSQQDIHAGRVEKFASSDEMFKALGI